MAHPVICAICGERFDRDKIQAVKHGARRYAHYSCDPNGEKVPLLVKEEDPDLKKLKEYIQHLFGSDTNYALVNKQIKDFVENKKYSYSGILKSLIYFYEVQGHSPRDGNGHGGIGIVPFVYQSAYNYYYDLFITKSLNENKNVQEITEKVKEIIIPLPKVKKKRRLFNIKEDEVE